MGHIRDTFGVASWEEQNLKPSPAFGVFLLEMVLFKQNLFWNPKKATSLATDITILLQGGAEIQFRHLPVEKWIGVVSLKQF